MTAFEEGLNLHATAPIYLTMTTFERARALWDFIGHKHAEVRTGFPDGRVSSHFANTPEQLQQIINEFNGKAQLWTGINERRDGGTKNNDVVLVRNLVLDIEPKNLKDGEYPTEAQRQACLDVANRIRARCKEKGISTFFVDSGRGFHVWIPLKDVAVNDANRAEVAAKYKRFYDLMREQFETEAVKIDTTSDLARVIGIPHTINIKWARERKPEGPLVRLPGDAAAEFLLGLKPVEQEAPRSVNLKLEHPAQIELPPCVQVALRDGIPQGQRHNFIYMLINALILKFNLSESEIAKIVLPLAKCVGLSEREVGDKIRYWKNEKKEYEPRTLCKHARDAKLCANPGTCYFFALPIRISDLRAELINNQVVVDAQIVGERSQMAIPKLLRIECPQCGADEFIEVASDWSLLKDYVLKTGEPTKLASWLFNVKHPGSCAGVVEGGEAKGTKKPDPRVQEVRWIDHAMILARDPLEQLGLERFSKRDYKPREIHLVGQVLPNSKKVRMWGKVALDKNRNITIVGNRIEPLESEASSFIATDEDKRAWGKYFANSGKVHNVVAPHVVGVKREIAKKFISLTYHSLATIPDVFGRDIRGYITEAQFGDTTTAKSQLSKDLTDQSESGWSPPLGAHVVCETSSRTGLLYGIDADRHILAWGELVLNDLGLVSLDGLDKMSSEELAEFREAQRSGRVSVRRTVSGDAFCRTRLITNFNPPKGMDQYIFPCVAITDTETFHNPTNITRLDVFVPFALDDVPAEEITNRKSEPRPIPPEIFARHVLWAWSRKPEQVVYEREAAELIKTEAARLIKKFTSQSLPIVSNESLNTICRFSVARAAERHSTDEAHEKVIVKPEHVRSAIADFEEVLRLLKLGDYKLCEEKRRTIDDNEFASICAELDATDLKLLDSIKLKGKPSAVLAEELAISETSVKNRYAKLKARELAEPVQRVGVALTSRGVAFMRLLEIKGLQLPEKREGQQKLNTCELCGKPAVGTFYGRSLCEEHRDDDMGRI